MATDDQTRRESQVDDASPEGGDAGASTEPDVEVSRDEGGAPVVEEGRRERRERERQEKRRKEYEEFNRPLAEQLTSLSRTVQSLNAALLARQAQAPVTQAAQPEEDDDPHFDAIREKQGALYARYSKAVESGDAVEAQKIAKEFNKLDRQALQHVAARVREELRGEIEARTAPREPEGITSAKQQYASVMSNELAKEYARGLHLQEEALARREGRTIDQAETFRKCLKAAGVKFGLIREDLPPPNPGQQARFGSVSPASNGRGAPFRRPLSEAERGFAHAMNPDMSEAEAEDAWVKGTLRTNPNYFRE